MPFTWIHEDTPRWDASKTTVIGGAPAGSLPAMPYDDGDLVPGEWFRVEEDGRTLGYGWMDHTWGDAEMLLAVAPEGRGRGVGTFILDHLEREAAARGLNYLHNAVRPTHPERSRMTRWLQDRGFEESGDGLLKRRVRVR
jgi:GNAT superfamily N-acetyltransferase